MSQSSKSPSLIVINQTTNPAFNDWLNALVEETGLLELWTGNAPHTLDNRIRIRHAVVYNRTSNRTRLITWLQFTLTVAWRLLWVDHRLPVIVVTNPPFLPLVIGLIHRIFRTPYIIIEWDIYPQIAHTMDILREGTLLYRVWYRWHQLSLRHATMIWTLGAAMADELRSMLPGDDLPVHIVPNWIDTNWLRPVPRGENAFAQQHQLDNKLVVLYSGNLGATHSIETILEIAKAVEDDPLMHFIIAGDGMKRQAIEAANLPNITLLSWQPPENVPAMFACADVGIVALAIGYEHFSVPSKIYGMLAAGNAILGISTAPNDLATIISQHQCGVNFAEAEVDGASQWLKNMVENRELLQQYQQAARCATVENYAASVCIPRMNQLVRDNLLKKDV
jgi:glycosyltransferase involved in cell wall biosynthesis